MLIMALTLAACGGNNDAPGETPHGGGNTTPPVNTPIGNTDTPTPAPTPDGGGNNVSVADIISDADIPDNGTPPDVSQSVNGLMESHRGDKGYFYASMDYIVWLEAETTPDYGTVHKYHMENYTDSMTTERFRKFVFDSNESAERYAQSDIGAYIAIDDVVYMVSPNVYDGHTRSGAVSSAENSLDYYISMPNKVTGVGKPPPGTTVPDVSNSVSGLMESHNSDAEYFYAHTDDWVVFLVVPQRPPDSVYDILHEYYVASFHYADNGHLSIEVYCKIVLSSNEFAEHFKSRQHAPSNFIVKDNVVYFLPLHEQYSNWNKDELLGYLQSEMGGIVLDYCVSKP